MDWIILTISEYIFTFFVETASFEIVFPKGGCFVAQIIGRCYNANEYYGSNVPLFRRNGYRQSGVMIP